MSKTSDMAAVFETAPEPPTELGRLRILSPSSGLRVSPLALGAMSIGQAWSDLLGGMDKEKSFKLLDTFYESGGNFIDTANNYQNEESETWLGEWMASRGNRDELVIATKFTQNYKLGTVGKGTKAANYSGNHRKSMVLSVRDSLKKLQTSYIDILYLHQWEYTTSVKEVMDSLHMLVQQGSVLYLGVSDTPAWIVAAANQYAIDSGKTPFSIYQGRWNVLCRDFERDIIPVARHYGMALAPWDVLGGGHLQSRRQVEERQRDGETLRKVFSDGTQTEEETRMADALYEVAKQHGSDSVAAVALAYVRGKADDVFPIVGGRKVEHLKANIEALKITLTDEQVRFIDSQKPFDLGFPNTFTGPDSSFTGVPNGWLSMIAPFEMPPRKGGKKLETVK